MPPVELALLHAKESFREFVPGNELVLLIDQHDRHGRVLKDRTIAPLGRLQLPLRFLTLQSVSDRADQDIRIDLPLDQIVLDPLLHGLRRCVFVVQSAQNDDGRLGRACLEAGHRVHPLAVGKAEIEKNNVEGAVLEHLQGPVEPICTRHVERRSR